MPIVMRIIQRFDACDEQAFMKLEKQFAELERRHKGFPRGRRLQPLASALPNNTLVWEAQFPTLNDAQAALDFFQGNAAHEKLAKKQRPLFRDVHIEFYSVLDT